MEPYLRHLSLRRAAIDAALTIPFLIWSALVSVLVGLIGALAYAPWVGIVVGVVDFATTWIWALRSARRTYIEVTETGIRAQFRGMAVDATWDSIDGVGILPATYWPRHCPTVDGLHVTSPELVGIDSRNRRRTVRAKRRQRLAFGVIVPIGLFDPDWRSGPIGAELSRRGIRDIAVTRPDTASS